MTTLSALVAASVAMLLGRPAASPTDTARQLDRNLQQFRTTAKPLMAGVAGLSGRRSIRRGQRVLTACDHYGRTLAANSRRYDDASGQLADAVSAAAAQICRNIDALDSAPDHAVSVVRATVFLDAAESSARQRTGDSQRLLTVVHALRQIDRAVVVTEAIDLGAEDAMQLTRGG